MMRRLDSREYFDISGSNLMAEDCDERCCVCSPVRRLGRQWQMLWALRPAEVRSAFSLYACKRRLMILTAWPMPLPCAFTESWHFIMAHALCPLHSCMCSRHFILVG